MSYLVHDIPGRPLEDIKTVDILNSGWLEEAAANHVEASAEDELRLTSSDIRRSLAKRYPLLRYAALSWCTHLLRAHGLENEELGQSQDGIGRLDTNRLQLRLDEMLNQKNPWTSILACFIVDRNSVTAWVEACCIFQYGPRLFQLLQAFEYLRDQGGSVTTMAGRELLWILSGIQQLDGALKTLWERFGTNLRQNPSLIWQNHITAAEDENFWPAWKTYPRPFECEARDRNNDGGTGFIPDHGNGRKCPTIEGDAPRYIS